MENEIAVIICQTNSRKVERLVNQLKGVNVPNGLSVSIKIISGAKSLAEAYNDGMKQSEAAYKIYIDEAVAVLNQTLLDWVVEAFGKYKNAGMIGWYGSEIPVDGDISKACSIYGTHCRLEINGTVTLRRGKNPIFCQTVDVVDGAIFATRGDVEWDEAVGDRFLLAAQCCRRKAAGQEIIVPMQNDCAICQVERDPVYVLPDNERLVYDVERRAFFEQYKEFIQPLVSIIIPTYNQPVFVTEAVESALAQDYENIEIVIGDDSTNEKTKLVMEEYEKKYANVHYYYHGGPLGGKGEKNWNFVLNHCHGEYVNYLLHDDLYMPTKISKMMKYYKQDLEETIGIVTSSRNLIDESGNEVHPHMNPWLPTQDSIEDGETIGRRIITAYINYIGETTTALIRKRDFRLLTKGEADKGDKYKGGRFFGYIDKSMGDVSVWLEMARRGKRCVFIRERLSSFRSHPEQNTHDPDIVARCMQDWISFAVLSWVNGVFFRNAEEVRDALCSWAKWFLSYKILKEPEGMENVILCSNLKKMVSFIESARYSEACLGVIDCIKKRQPEGGVIIPDNYLELCERLDRP